MDVCTHGYMDGWVKGQKDEWVDGWIYGCMMYTLKGREMAGKLKGVNR